jgi:S-adenosylmethionine synthetase
MLLGSDDCCSQSHLDQAKPDLGSERKTAMNVTVTNGHGPAQEDLVVEMVERKGLGHPDTICDRAAEELSRRLSRWYIENAGCILHHNVDKALLVAGESRPAFGGGEITKPLELILCGRATPEIEGGPSAPIELMAIEGTREWLAEAIPQLTKANLEIDSRIGIGSLDLRKICDTNEVPLSNDTSFAVAYAPLSETERLVYDIERLLNSSATKQQWPMLGTDVKVLGVRTGDAIRLTVAVAFIGKQTESLEHYFTVKDEVRELVLSHAQQLTRLAGTELAEAQVCTLQRKLLKLGVLVKQSCRRVWLRFPSSCPVQHLWPLVLARIRA